MPNNVTGYSVHSGKSSERSKLEFENLYIEDLILKELQGLYCDSRGMWSGLISPTGS